MCFRFQPCVFLHWVMMTNMFILWCVFLRQMGLCFTRGSKHRVAYIMLPKYCLLSHVTNSINPIRMDTLFFDRDIEKLHCVKLSICWEPKCLLEQNHHCRTFFFCVFTTTGYVGNVSFEILPFLMSHPIDMSLRCKYMVGRKYTYNHLHLFLWNHQH